MFTFFGSRIFLLIGICSLKGRLTFWLWNFIYLLLKPLTIFTFLFLKKSLYFVLVLKICLWHRIICFKISNNYTSWGFGVLGFWGYNVIGVLTSSLGCWRQHWGADVIFWMWLVWNIWNQAATYLFVWYLSLKLNYKDHNYLDSPIQTKSFNHSM